MAFPNTTIYKHTLNVIDSLSAESKKAINFYATRPLMRHEHTYSAAGFDLLPNFNAETGISKSLCPSRRVVLFFYVILNECCFYVIFNEDYFFVILKSVQAPCFFRKEQRLQTI